MKKLIEPYYALTNFQGKRKGTLEPRKGNKVSTEKGSNYKNESQEC